MARMMARKISISMRWNGFLITSLNWSFIMSPHFIACWDAIIMARTIPKVIEMVMEFLKSITPLIKNWEPVLARKAAIATTPKNSQNFFILPCSIPITVINCHGLLNNGLLGMG